jgi:hypothetical protein
MQGVGASRFCEHCGKFVHDLSEMPTDEAERLLCSAAGSMCIRFARDAQTGDVITLDYAPIPQISRRRALLTIGSVAAAVVAAATMGAVRLFRRPPVPVRTPMVMGDWIGPTPPPIPPAPAGS